jgi:glutathione synthase
MSVSVLYLRAGYSPNDYPSDTEWKARWLMEACNAVSCPSAAYQLVGAKKIQQDLANPGVGIPSATRMQRCSRRARWGCATG